MTIESLDWREQLAAVIEFSSDAILLLDPDARVRSWSPGAERLFGYAFEEIEGRPVSMLLPPSRIASRTYRLLRLLARGRRVNNYETVGRRKDGRPVNIALSISPISSVNGTGGACLIARDVGHRRRAEERRQQQARRARLRADVASAFGRAELDLDEALQACADAMVRYLDVAGARIWMTAEGNGTVALAASAGVPPPCRVDGAPSDQASSIVGRIAASRDPFISNDVRSHSGDDLADWLDPRDTAGFVAYPVVVREQAAGVVGVFARTPLRHETVDVLAWVAQAIAHGIERARTKDALRESEARFLAIAESGVAAVVIHRGNILYANAETETLTGYPREALTRMHISDLIHPDMRDQIRDMAGARLAGKPVPTRFETPVLTRSGETRWVDVGARLVSYQGEPAVVAVALDVTDRKRMEDAVQEREALVHALAETDLVAVIVYEGNRLLDASGATALTGYSREELLAMPDFFQIIHPGFREAARARAQARTRGERVPTRAELKMISKSGEELWVYACAARSSLSEGRALVAVLVDITDRKRAEEALRRSEDQHRSIVAAMQEGVMLVDASGAIQACNTSAQRILGLTSAELIGRPASDTRWRRIREDGSVFQPEDLPGFVTVRTGSPQVGVVIGVERPDGTLAWICVNAEPLVRPGDTRPYAAVLSFSDITERKAAEQELRTRGEAERKARLSAEILSDANMRLTRTLDLHDTLEALLDALARVAPYDSASIISVEEEYRSLAMRGYERWTDPERVREITRQIGTSRLKRQMFTSGHGVIVSDTRTRSDWRRFPETAYIRSWMGVPLFAGTQLIALFSLDKAEPGFFTDEHLRMAEALAGPASVALQNARLFRQVTSARQRLEMLSKRLVEVQEAERREIARELHDEIGQSMTGLKLTLEAMPRVAPEARENKLRDAQGLVMDLMTRVRELSLSLRPPVLDDMGLLAGLVALFDRYTAQTHVEVVFSHHELDSRLPPEIETAAFRVVQEALTNVARHARVNKVYVRLRVVPDSLLGLISDEGAGFDAAETMSVATGGLSGMKERVALLGGWFWVESSSGKGTRIVMALPLKSNAVHA